MNLLSNPIRRALISVSDKTGLDVLCPFLASLHCEIFSTQGTAEYLKKTFHIQAKTIDSITDFPEILGGRVKTLHPKIFGGILARREEASDQEQVEKHGIPLFDLVVVNLYPFWEHIGKSPQEQSSFIDIGGPSMLRAAAKNNRSVAVLSDPSDYKEFIDHVTLHQGTLSEFRHSLAGRTFSRTSRYDASIATEWNEKNSLPEVIALSPHKKLRYGENPHQAAAWAGKAQWSCLQGKELSYNNLLDAEAATGIVAEFSKPALCIIKHNNPCGVAAGEESLSELFQKALSCDPKSAFGGILATNRQVEAKAAETFSTLFLEVIIAPSFSSEARELFGKKQNLRLIEWAAPIASPVEIRAALGGWLLQTHDGHGIPLKFEWVTSRKEETLKDDLLFTWLVTKHVRSNAIVLAKNGQTIGIGAGQMSRVDAVQVALSKTISSQEGAVLGSDAFFPFRDNIDLLKGRGIKAIIQPGGSQRDGEVIQACNELGIAMVFTGERHFKH